MSGSNWDRVVEIVEGAESIEGEDREEYLLEACAGDTQLLHEVRRILDADPPSDFIEPPAPDPILNAELAAGTRLGEFEIIRRIGQGGMGVVYLAHQVALDRDVAIKVLPTGPRTSAARQRFEEEPRIASKFHHPHALTVITGGVSNDVAWFAMPYVDGHDLGHEIELQRKAAPARLLPDFRSSAYLPAVVRCVADVADALQAAHDAAVLHRDVKPRNLLLDRQGHARVADFGLAKDLDADSFSASQEVKGTPYYMSPEQARALRAPIDHRTDVYSLSVVLYEALTLQRPFQGGTYAEILAQISSGVHTGVRTHSTRVPRDLAVICEKGMARSPADRYATAADLGLDLRRFLNHEAIVARPPSWFVRSRRAVARRPWHASTVLAIVTALILGLGLQSWLTGRTVRAGWRNAIHHAFVDGRLATSPVVLHEGWNAAHDLLESASPESNGGQRAQELIAEMEAWRSRSMQAIQVAHATGRGKPQRPLSSGTVGSPRQPHALTIALARARDLQVVFGKGDPQLNRFADPQSIWSELTVRLDDVESPAVLRIRPLDPVDETLGEFLQAVSVPIEGYRVPPGTWRCRVTLEDGRFFEWDRRRHIGDAPTTQVIRKRQFSAATSGMVLISAGPVAFGPDSPAGCCPTLEVAEVPAFWIDEDEVSNADVLAYLIATSFDHAPQFWRDIGFRTRPEEMGIEDPTAWLSLPAVALSWTEARDYAEWRGDRLVSHFEFERASRADSMRLWPDDTLADGTPSLRNVDRPTTTGPMGGAQDATELNRRRYRNAFESTIAVNEPGYRQGPFGLFHVCGNVAEWTGSSPITVRNGRLHVLEFDRLYMGGGWDAAARRFDLSMHPFAGDWDAFASPHVGFRCARSAH